jgi:acyl-CoA dehydrogenase
MKADLADCFAELELARLAVGRAAWLFDAVSEAAGGLPKPDTPEFLRAGAASSLAKLQATEAAGRIVDRAVQIHGGVGVVVGSIVERLYREVRALRIYEGTSEIQRLIVARELLQGSLADEPV